MAKTLLEVIEEQGLEIVEGSSGLSKVRCPFHQGDNNPSLTIYETGTYFCFACEAWGDAVKFLVDFKGWSAKDALEYVGEDYEPPKRKKSQVIKVRNLQQSWKFLYDVASTYHEYLKETPGPQNYLHSRGLTDETIYKYKLGYSDGAILKLFYAWEHELAEKLGILTKNGFELMSHRITIPNLLDNHFCDFIVGRTVINDRAKYLNTHGGKPLLGFYEVRNSPILFIVEGQMDYLTLRQWGYPAVILGGSHVTSSQKILLHERKIVILPDYEESGIGLKGAQGLKRAFGENAMILDYSKLNPYPGTKLDVNTLATIPGAEDAFREVVKEEVEWIKSLSNRQLEKYFPSTVLTTINV